MAKGGVMATQEEIEYLHNRVNRLKESIVYLISHLKASSDDAEHIRNMMRPLIDDSTLQDLRRGDDD